MSKPLRKLNRSIFGTHGGDTAYRRAYAKETSRFEQGLPWTLCKSKIAMHRFVQSIGR